MKNAVIETDEEAFLMFTETSEVFGEGFGEGRRKRFKSVHSQTEEGVE